MSDAFQIAALERGGAWRSLACARVRAKSKVVGVRDEAEAAEIRVEAGRRVGEPAAGCLGAMVREAKESLPVEVVLTQHRVGIHARVYRRDV